MRKILMSLSLCLVSNIAFPNIANALTMSLSAGIDGIAGTGTSLSGANDLTLTPTNQGSFAPFDPVVTVDFNNSSAYTVAGNVITQTVTLPINGALTLTFTQTAIFGGAAVNFGGLNAAGGGIYQFNGTGDNPPYNDYAPPGANGSYNPSITTLAQVAAASATNVSRYLSIGDGNQVSITLSRPVRFFGVDFGFIDNGNVVTIQRKTGADTTTGSGGTAAPDIIISQGNSNASPTAGFDLSLAPYNVVSNQSAYISINSQTSDEWITGLTLQAKTTALETDNYAFSYGFPLTPISTPVPFEFSPTFGILSLVGLYSVRRYIKNRAKS